MRFKKSSGESYSSSEPMSDAQIEVLAQFVANSNEIINQMAAEGSKVAQRAIAEQEDVAETRRRAQRNPELLRLRILGRMGAGDLTNLL